MSENGQVNKVEIGANKGARNEGARITPDTPYGECSERLTAFGGLLALVKFLDLIGFEKAFTERYVYRVFVTNEIGRPHRVINDYDQRADAENLIGEAQREGVPAIPSRRFQAHHAYFQIVMLAYNLWRWMKMLAGYAERQKQQGTDVPEPMRISMPNHTIRIARLKTLFVAAKIRSHGNRDEVRYSMHEQRAAGLIDFMGYLDRRRKEVRAVA